MLFKKLIVAIMAIQLCFVVTACDTEISKQQNIIYTPFENKMYFKGKLYSLYPTLADTTFYFPILSNKRIGTLSNVAFYDNDLKIDGDIVVITETRVDKKIREGLYLNIIEFQLNIQNIEGTRVSKIFLTADEMHVSYDVDIELHYYIEPGYNLSTQGDMLLEYDDTTFTLIYGYASLTTISKFNYLESMLDGVEVEKLYIADGNNKNEMVGELPWVFNDIENDSSNTFAFKNNVLKIKCDYTQIKQEAVFFKDAFRANLSIGEDQVEIIIPDITSNSLIELYTTLCENLQLEND